MKKEVLLFAEEIICDSAPLIGSGQSQVFFGYCPQRRDRIVVKQIDILANPEALIKELQILQLYVRSLSKLQLLGDQDKIIYRQNSEFQSPQGLPRIIGFAHTQKIAELKMEYCGESVQAFMSSTTYKLMTPYQRSCVGFDMLRQIVEPLSQLHLAGLVHGDIKPDNICMRKWTDKNQKSSQYYCKQQRKLQMYKSEFQFTLIDFGIMSKFKVKKVCKIYEQPIGNLKFCSLRGLQCMQTRYQDDIESMMYLVYYFILNELPWEQDQKRICKSFVNLDYERLLEIYQSLRLDNQEYYLEQLHSGFSATVNDSCKTEVKFGEQALSPFQRLSVYLQDINLHQAFHLSDCFEEQEFQQLQQSLEQKFEYDKLKQFQNKQKQIQDKFQISYIELDQILDWPNDYLKPSQLGNYITKNQETVTPQPIQRNSKVHQFDSLKSTQNGFKFIDRQVQSILDNQIQEIRVSSSIKQLQEQLSNQKLNKARNYILKQQQQKIQTTQIKELSDSQLQHNSFLTKFQFLIQSEVTTLASEEIAREQDGFDIDLNIFDTDEHSSIQSIQFLK